ncbi:MAG TPA: cardiolipin synthase [Anaeromyxobacteraceae bacterium]|nr:cardiolipin synthase [Anaeromyxobacteraceae bacterium]
MNTAFHVAWLLPVLNWSIRLWAIWAVPRRRSPNAARAWILLILVAPIAGLALYAVFGRAYLPAQRLARQKEANRRIRESPALARLPEVDVEGDRSEPTARLARALGGFPVVGGNRVELLDGYDDAVDRLVADVDAARESVHLMFYIFEPDATGRRVADAVIRAASRGVSCCVMMDGLASRPGLARLAPGLRDAGVEVVSLLSPGTRRARRDLRNHRKIAVIDGRIGHTGSQNVVDAYDYKGRGLTNEELVVRVEGPVTWQLQAVFLTDRFLDTGRSVDDARHYPDPPRAGSVRAQVLPSGPTYAVENNERTFVQMLYGARERIVVTSPYFVPDRPFVEAMQAGAARGLDVRLVTPLQADQWLVRLAQESYYDELLAAGVKIHLYRPRFLHAKHISVDRDLCAIGSSNLDMRSFTLNEEDMVLFYDPAVVSDLVRIQERTFRDSELLTREAWARRPALRRTAQQLARLVDSVL